MSNELQSITNKFIRDFSEIQRKYQESKYKLECGDDEYKDSEENIFDDSGKIKLYQFIMEESLLYKHSVLSYGDLVKKLSNLEKSISEWLRTMRGRGFQGIFKAKKMYDSEKYYLNDMKLRLSYFSKLAECLNFLQIKERDLLSRGIEISVDSGYEAYLLNKCIVMGVIPYCRSECTKLVKELNDRVSNSTSYCGEFYYKLAELNFTLQRYKDADPLIDRAIKTLQDEAVGISSKDKKNSVIDMLFSAFQLKALGLEFCGEYAKSIEFLTGYNPEQFVKVFLKTVPGENINEIIFSIDSDSSHKKEADCKREQVIKLIGSVLKDNIFLSDIAKFVYDKNNQKSIFELVDYENNIKQHIIEDCCPEEYANKVFESNKIEKKDIILLNEYVHILAHCVNEQGVTLLKETNTEEDVKLAENLIVLGRALMLYVSEQREIYKSCFATTYAEAGDLWIANKELERIIENSDYSQYDVTTKAEISFFCHIIGAALLLENGSYNSEYENSNGIYNRYLNYCYRSFDYDAVAHMRVYSFRNRIAEIMQSGDLPNMAKSFLDFANTKAGGKNAFQEFVENVYFQNTNQRLHFEYEKTKYMYCFLIIFFRECIAKETTAIIRDSRIIDNALKYLHYYNAAIDNFGSRVISYIDFRESYGSIIEQLLIVVHGSKLQDNIVESKHCRLVLIESAEDADDFAKRISEYKSEAKSHMFFVACVSEELFSNLNKALEEKKERTYPEFRFFPSFEQGIKEFLVFTVFFLIQDDFTDPNNIFVMTPIGTAKACRYRVVNNVELLNDSYAKLTESSISVGLQREISAQYRVIASCFSKEYPWEKSLNSERFKNNINLIISVIYENNSNTNILKYRYKYNVSDDWMEALLFDAIKWKQKIDNLYYKLKYESAKIPDHIWECSNTANSCNVIMIDDVINSSNDITLSDKVFSVILSSFSNTIINICRTVLIWKGTNNSYVSWRIVCLNDNVNSTVLNEIRQLLCQKGKGLELLPISSSRYSRRYTWPKVHDFENDEKPFLFVSHYGEDDDLVKRELSEFFAKYNIPIWYDRDKLIKDETWKDRVNCVINNANCVGMVVLITNEKFFESSAIQYEIDLAREKAEKEKKNRKTFSIIPIVYGVALNHEELRILILKSINNNDSLLLRIKNTIIPSDDKVILYLLPNQSLAEYTIGEQNEGREGSLLKAFTELKLFKNLED